MLPDNPHLSSSIFKILNALNSNHLNNSDNSSALGSLAFNNPGVNNMTSNLLNTDLFRSVTSNTNKFFDGVLFNNPSLTPFNPQQCTSTTTMADLFTNNNHNQKFPVKDYLSSLPTIAPPSDSSTSSSSSDSPSTSCSTPTCKICGGPCRSLNGLGSEVCKSCREFFRRSTLGREAYKCSRIGRCDVDVEKVRKLQQCRACRMKKLLDYGMDPKEVFKRAEFKTPKPLIFSVPQKKIVESPTNGVSNGETSQKFLRIKEPNPEIQFFNIRDCTKSFLHDVLSWPRQNKMFQEFSDEEKITLLHSQWVYISFLTICENGAHLLDLNEKLSSMAHAFHVLSPSSHEVYGMKTVILFMKKKPDHTFLHQYYLDDALQDLYSAVGPYPTRFADLLEFLGGIIYLPLADIRLMFNEIVFKNLPKYV